MLNRMVGSLVMTSGAGQVNKRIRVNGTAYTFAKEYLEDPECIPIAREYLVTAGEPFYVKLSPSEQHPV
jgi:hypothetical protein